jgi:hypothetical protein
LIIVELTVNVNIAAITSKHLRQKEILVQTFPNCLSEVCLHT